ncbi:hypothetical protein CXF85_15270 [Colwellia sp. 75C3]|uniref:hypothetical protein n=1 Tax=Colwellia sp. 75C3 TaxID=888425 RepID=UPI000C33191C|nr:hypothetical protein [Colwellia sp. 75C3]PKG81895.1 hypothetical protein CXF85_15270 [Colwellia sp. 75C3]
MDIANAKLLFIVLFVITIICCLVYLVDSSLKGTSIKKRLPFNTNINSARFKRILLIHLSIVFLVSCVALLFMLPALLFAYAEIPQWLEVFLIFLSPLYSTLMWLFPEQINILAGIFAFNLLDSVFTAYIIELVISNTLPLKNKGDNGSFSA